MSTLRIRTGVAIILLGVTSGCNPFRRDYSLGWLISSESSSVNVVLDSAAVRQLIAAETVRQRHERGLEEKGGPTEIHDRSAFLKSFASFPSIMLPAGTRVRILESTSCRCNPRGQLSESMIQARLLDGPEEGKVGWICDTFVGRSTPAL